MSKKVLCAAEIEAYWANGYAFVRLGPSPPGPPATPSPRTL